MSKALETMHLNQIILTIWGWGANREGTKGKDDLKEAPLFKGQQEDECCQDLL